MYKYAKQIETRPREAIKKAGTKSRCEAAVKPKSNVKERQKVANRRKIGEKNTNSKTNTTQIESERKKINVYNYLKYANFKQI